MPFSCAGTPHLLCHFVAEVEHAVERLELLAAVFTAKQANRTDAHVDDTLVVRIDGERAHVAVHDLGPALTAIFGAIAGIEGDCGKKQLRPLAPADDVLQGLALEKLADGVQANRRGFP